MMTKQLTSRAGQSLIFFFISIEKQKWPLNTKRTVHILSSIFESSGFLGDRLSDCVCVCVCVLRGRNEE